MPASPYLETVLESIRQLSEPFSIFIELVAVVLITFLIIVHPSELFSLIPCAPEEVIKLLSISLSFEFTSKRIPSLPPVIVFEFISQPLTLENTLMPASVPLGEIVFLVTVQFVTLYSSSIPDLPPSPLEFGI